MAVIFESLIRQLSLTFLYAGYRHVYLEGMEEASIFVHVAVNDVTGKVGITAETSLKSCSLCSQTEMFMKVLCTDSFYRCSCNKIR